MEIAQAIEEKNVILKAKPQVIETHLSIIRENDRGFSRDTKPYEREIEGSS